VPAANADAIHHAYSHTVCFTYGDSECYSNSNTYSYSKSYVETTPKSASSSDSALIGGLAIGRHLTNTCCCRQAEPARRGGFRRKNVDLFLLNS
jgi:hypothetical protein